MEESIDIKMKTAADEIAQRLKSQKPVSKLELKFFNSYLVLVKTENKLKERLRNEPT